MKNKKGILILLTPYHLHQYLNIVRQYNLPNSNLIIFHSKIVSANQIKNSLSCTNSIYMIPEGNVSFAQLKTHPIQTYKHLKFLLKKYSAIINLATKKLQNNIPLFIGSDKDLFTQMLVQLLGDSINNVHAFDEGTSYYISDSKKDYVKDKLFMLFSKLIWGYKFRYVRTMGRSSWIDTIYARIPGLITHKKAEVFPINSSKRRKKVANSKKMLFISSPLSEFDLMSTSDEERIYDKVLSMYSKEYKIFIKPHPSDRVNKFQHVLNKQNINIIKEHILAEKLDYYEYKVIVNFGSSVIIDILSSHYPSKNIVTFHVSKHMQLPTFFKKTKVISFTKK